MGGAKLKLFLYGFLSPVLEGPLVMGILSNTPFPQDKKNPK